MSTTLTMSFPLRAIIINKRFSNLKRRCQGRPRQISLFWTTIRWVQAGLAL